MSRKSERTPGRDTSQKYPTFSAATGSGSPPDANRYGPAYPPMLVPASPSGGPGNFEAYSKAVAPWAESKHGDVARLITLHQHFVPEPIPEPDPQLTDRNDPLGVERAAHRIKCERRVVRMCEARERWTHLSADLVGTLSPASLELLKAYIPPDRRGGTRGNRGVGRGDDQVAGPTVTWDEYQRTRDPLILWLLIVRTHAGSTTGHATDDAVEALQRYYSLAQTASESTDDFKSRVDQALMALEATGQQPPADHIQAALFIKGLDMARYAQLQASLTNEETRGLDTRPKTLQQAYRYALGHRAVLPVQRTGSTPQSSAVFTVVNPTEPRASGISSRKAGKKKKGKGQKGFSPANPECQARLGEMARKEEKSSSWKGCALCGDTNHGVSQCPHLSKARHAVKRDGKPAHITGCAVSAQQVGVSGVAFTACAISASTQRSQPQEHLAGLASAARSPQAVILDTGADTSVFHNRDLLSNVRRAKCPAILHGVGGTVEVTEVGDFGDLGEVYYTPHTPVNALSMSRVAAVAKIAYCWTHGGGQFRIHLPGGSLTFESVGGLYVADFETAQAYVQTVAEKASVYTRRQVADAKRARELEQRLGHASKADVKRLLSSGSILNTPVTQQDVDRAVDIWGPNVPALAGKTKQQASRVVRVEPRPPFEHPAQTLHADIMFVGGEPHLVVVAQPLGLTLAKCLLGRMAGALASAISHMIAELRSRGFAVSTLLSDGEKGMGKLVPMLHRQGVGFNLAGPGQHVPVVEAKIRAIKERVRAILAGLPYKLPASLLKYCVSYAVARLNMMPSSTRVDPTSPRELFLGRKVDATTDLRLAFGDYVQAKDNLVVSNSMAPRTLGAIALEAVGNLQGTWRFYCLASKTVRTFDQWVPLPMPQEVVSALNALAHPSRQGWAGPDPVILPEGQALDEDLQDDQPPDQATTDVGLPEPLPPVEDPASTSEAEDKASDVEERVEQDVITEVHEVGEEQAAELQEKEQEEEEQEEEEEEDAGAPRQLTQLQPDEAIEDSTDPPEQQPEPAPRFPVRANRTTWKERSLFFIQAASSERNATGNISPRRAMELYGDVAEKAIQAELQQMLDLEVWTPIHPGSLSSHDLKNAIFSSMFLREKYLPNGNFDKLKARLVANGNQQDRRLYETSSVSSPAVALSSVFMGAGIAAAESRSVITLDITGAYLKVSMTGNTVHVRLPAYVANVLCRMRPEYHDYRLRDGTIVVRLQKALYGCLESGRLLFEHIKGTLQSAGFEQNPYDLCVFNRGSIEKQCSVYVYVDDLMITCVDPKLARQTAALLAKVYKTVKIREGPQHSYLGMDFDYTKRGKCSITMKGFVEDLLRGCKVKGIASSPAAPNLFELDEESLPLKEDQRKEFHSIAAKLLYLAKRVRPDILLATSFLSTRVTVATDQDKRKLDRVLKYLNGTAEIGLVLQFGAGMTLLNYIDAAFAVHADYKSHTGAGSTLGGGLFDCKSIKQRLVTKSSTEAELVGVSDYLSEVIHKREFLKEQGYRMEPAVLFQDNLSTIAMANNGRSSSDRTRHVNIRYFFIKDRIEAREIEVQHKPTAEMIADILTKPLQGELFRKLRAALLNWHE